ncbi:reverse transcriptase domain-containing protein [Tanacetum coccineum]
MADNRTMAQMLQAPIEGYEDAIVVPPINANNFELKQPLINLVQSNKFTGRQDPHNHLRFFNKVTSTFRHPEVPNTSVKLLLFPFSLDGEARDWLDKEPPRSILTWDDLVSKFINQYFPPSKTTYYRNEIITFYQKPNEAFNEAWERFKGLLRQCPHHGFSELHQLDTFYNSLNSNDQDALDSAAGGNFLDKMPQEGLAIIESKSKVRYSRSRANDSRVSTDAPLSNSSSSNNSFDMQQIAASLEDKMTIKMNKMLNEMKALVVTTPAPVKAVEERVLPPTTQEEQFADEKERKARTLLLMAVPKDHLRRFHGMDDAKEIWAAIKTSFLRSLPPAWDSLAMTMRTKKNIDTLSIDDLYNNLSVFEQDHFKKTSSSSLASDNVAFISQAKASSSKHKPSQSSGSYSSYTTSSSKATPTATPGLADEVIHSFLATNADDVDLIHEDLDQIDDLDLEEMDINWQIAMTAIKIKKFYKKTGRRPRVDGKMHVAFDKRKVECFNCHNTGHFARECKFKGSKEGSRQEAGRGQDFKPVRTEKEALMTIDEGQINWVEQTTDEELNHALMAFTVNNEDHPLKHMEHRGIFDSGCSGHMTGNRAHLEDYQELNKVGSVTFGGSKGSISGKECFVVSIDFKMPDENQVLLKVPRQHNMYTFDMKPVDFFKRDTLEFSNARTPQQNGVAERMNRTLIEAARTMLADSLLPTTFWAEAVNTACYTFNRVRVTKPSE